MKDGRTANATNLSLGIEHLQLALEYAGRGRKVFFDEAKRDTLIIVEAELRKAYESLNRLGPSIWNANSSLPRDRIGEIRRRLTHDYAGIDPEEIWRIASTEARPLLHLLMKVTVREDPD
ncbi:MAG: HepT-like ribonuclease domain-containing protein [Thermoplasmata archaeon]